MLREDEIRSRPLAERLRKHFCWLKFFCCCVHFSAPLNPHLLLAKVTTAATKPVRAENFSMATLKRLIGPLNLFVILSTLDEKKKRKGFKHVWLEEMRFVGLSRQKIPNMQHQTLQGIFSLNKTFFWSEQVFFSWSLQTIVILPET